MGLSDHFGVKLGFGLYLLKNWIVLNATPALLHIAQSNVFHIRFRTVNAIVRKPLFPQNSSELELPSAKLVSPGLSRSCLRPDAQTTPPKSLSLHSLQVKISPVQRKQPNGY